MQRRALLSAGGTALGVVAGCVTVRTDDGTATERPRHHFYLLNLDDSSRRIAVRVERPDADSVAVVGTYELPERTGAEFRDAVAWNGTYEVTGTVESGPEEWFTWTTGNCATGEGTSGSRTGYLRVEPGGHDLTFGTDLCDEGGVGVPTGRASAFEVA